MFQLPIFVDLRFQDIICKFQCCLWIQQLLLLPTQLQSYCQMPCSNVTKKFSSSSFVKVSISNKPFLKCLMVKHDRVISSTNEKPSQGIESTQLQINTN